MIFLYNIFGIVFLILSPLIILIRLISGKEEKNRFLEKYSLNDKKNNIQTIWFHGASVGEIMTILPVIKKFEENKKVKKILLTSSTTSSASIIKRQNFKKTTHAYYPFDIGFICNNFLRKWKPKIAIFVDSEIWPNMYERLYLKKIPIILINGRITKKSFERWSKMPSFANNIFSKISIALPQNKETKNYLNRLGVKKIKYIGNLKYFKNNKPISKINIKKYFKNKIVFCAASTHHNEEIIIGRLHLDLKQKFKDLITIIIPRHINRSEDIIENLKNLKLKVIKRTSGLKPSSDCDILVVDTYGEMSNFLELSKYLLKGKGYACLATHDLELINNIEDFVQLNKIDKSKFEFQALHGVPIKEKLNELKNKGYNVRIYVPYGPEWFEYSIRRIKENPKIVSYILKNMFKL